MTFSLCMIVKNESAVIRNCLDSLKSVMDEIIIVDTGSTDNTKEIVREYTTNVYDYVWKDDFADARNFAFSKATGDYIYSADADEVLDQENQRKLSALKCALVPEVEIVQMIYVTEQMNHPTENFKRDLRPKLFKRLRTFTWIEPIHETVNIDPVVFDSDIEIIHRPQGCHSSRDFQVFEKIIAKEKVLSERLIGMYLRELYKAGTEEELERAKVFFEETLVQKRTEDKGLLCRQIIAVLLKTYRLLDDSVNMLKVSLSQEATIPSAEICMELGYFFVKKEDYQEAAEWFHRAAFDCESEIDVASSGTSAFMALALCYRKLAKIAQAKVHVQKEEEQEYIRLTNKAAEYEQMACDWKPQEPQFAG